jgi:hypothetical protein
LLVCRASLFFMNSSHCIDAQFRILVKKVFLLSVPVLYTLHNVILYSLVLEFLTP